MHSVTAKRTLVKSHPELWSELSEIDRLARHLEAFGEITITKLEPEHTVAWEGESASGTVSIEPSGWGTKVTLTATVEARESQETEAGEEAGAVSEPEAIPEPEGIASPEPEAEEGRTTGVEPATDPPPGPATEAERVTDPPSGPAAEAEPPTDPPPAPEVELVGEPAGEPEAERAPKRGLLAWLLGRPPKAAPPGRESSPRSVPAEGATVEPEAEPVEPDADLEPEPGPVEPSAVAVEPEADPVEPSVSAVEAEPVAVEAGAGSAETAPAQPGQPDLDQAGEPQGAAAGGGGGAVADFDRAQAALEGALEALGSAHHRPFSRG